MTAHRTIARPARGLALAAVGALLAACGSSSFPGSAASPSTALATTSTAPAPLSGRIVVLAAASLTESFGELAATFQREHPGTTVGLDTGPSSGLATSIVEGAPADVFAAASRSTMDPVVEAQLAAGPRTFARNVMEIAVPADNPARITSLPDLARPGVKVALCQAQVPCGVTAATVLANAGLTVTPVTAEVDVKATLTKVESGDVDAALVYATDVRAAGSRVVGIPVPGDVNASTSYPIATLASSQNPGLARAFVDAVLSPAGAAVLEEAGFEKP